MSLSPYRFLMWSRFSKFFLLNSCGERKFFVCVLFDTMAVVEILQPDCLIKSASLYCTDVWYWLNLTKMLQGLIQGVTHWSFAFISLHRGHITAMMAESHGTPWPLPQHWPSASANLYPGQLATHRPSNETWDPCISQRIYELIIQVFWYVVLLWFWF